MLKQIQDANLEIIQKKLDQAEKDTPKNVENDDDEDNRRDLQD
jgi:hypothetical protein